VDDPPRITAAELRVRLDGLGLDAQQAARLLCVRHDTVRRWVSGREMVPVRVGDELLHIEAVTRGAVDALVDVLCDAPRVEVYRTDERLHAARPEYADFPASWWRMVVARATRVVPESEISYG
jgi:DNA-binding transcriptional regulator YdaS (Cro superfamily)